MTISKFYMKMLIMIFFFFVIDNAIANQPQKSMSLSQIDLLHKVCERNFEIKYQKYDLNGAYPMDGGERSHCIFFEPGLR